MKVMAGAGRFTRSGELAHWVEHLRVADLSVGTYSVPAGGADDQEPHAEDDVYVVTAGRAMFEAGQVRVAVGPGSVLFVAAGEVHRFTEVSEDLAAVVVFAPAEGSRSAG